MAPATQTQSRAFIAAMVICCILSVFFCVCYFGNSKGTCDISLDDKINPNTAPGASLIRLPNIGPSLAEAIIEYRRQQHDSIVFRNANDLQKISGIGPKTIESMKPSLSFDSH